MNVVARVLLGEVSAITSRMSFDRFCTTTPRRRTSSGNRGSAIDVGADLEGGGDRERAVGGGGGGEIDHPLGAGELLLDGSGDRRGDGLGRGARVGRGDGDRGRCDLGI